MSARPTGWRRLAAGAAGWLGVALLPVLAALALLGGREWSAGATPPEPTAPPLRTPTSAADRAAPDQLGGSVLLNERFDQPAGSDFVAREDDTARYAFEQGGYMIAVKARETVVWTLADGRYGDVVVSVDTVAPPGQGRAAAGLVFHYQDDRNFYLFQIASAGYYTLELVAADELITLIDWTQSDAIDAAANQLRVETRGDRIALYVNGQRLEETRDTSFTRGAAGIATSSFAEPGTAIRFDNLMIVQLS